VYRDHPALRAFLTLTRESTDALVSLNTRLGTKRVYSIAFDLLPNDYGAVQNGHLDLAVDQQPYLQGFSAVLQLFLARISEGLVRPSGVIVPPVFVDRAGAARFLATKSRFEGSTSRHNFPLARG
jgi:simple sugar transport system substrate-binding protein